MTVIKKREGICSVFRVVGKEVGKELKIHSHDFWPLFTRTFENKDNYC